MGSDAETFFKHCDIGYLTGKLSRQGESKKSLAYLEKIVSAIKADIAYWFHPTTEGNAK